MPEIQASTYVRSLAVVHPNVKYISDFVKASSVALHECTRHQATWWDKPSRLLTTKGHVCPLCITEKNKQARATKARTNDGNVVLRNWKMMFDALSSAIVELEFDVAKEALPRLRIVKARRQLLAAMGKLEEHKITRVGRSNIRTDIGNVINGLNSVRAAMIDASISDEKVQKLLPTYCDSLQKVCGELTTQVETEIEQQKVADQTRRRDEVAAAKAALEAITAAEKRKPKLFNSFQDAMKTKKDISREEREERERRHQERRQKEKFDEANRQLGIKPDVDETPEFAEPKIENKYTGRHDEAIQKLVERMDKEIPKVKDQLKKSGILDSDEPTFAMLKAPIAVIFAHPINEKRLEAIDISYTLIPTATIRFGGNPEPWRQKSVEHLPPTFVLDDQLLVAFGQKHTLKTQTITHERNKNPKVRFPNPRRIKTAASSAFDKKAALLLRKDICAIISVKTGMRYIDVLRESGKEEDATFIADRNFPGLRFIWLLRTSLYNQIGPLKVRQASFPFSKQEVEKPNELTE